MFLIKLIFKVLALPIVAALTLIQWGGLFVTSVSSVFFNLFAWLCFLLAVSSYLMGISTGSEAVKTIGMGFVAYIMPVIACWMIKHIAIANLYIKDFIWS